MEKPRTRRVCVSLVPPKNAWCKTCVFFVCATQKWRFALEKPRTRRVCVSLTRRVCVSLTRRVCVSLVPPKNAWRKTCVFFASATQEGRFALETPRTPLLTDLDKLVNPFLRNLQYYNNTNNPLKTQFVGVWSAIYPFLRGVSLQGDGDAQNALKCASLSAKEPLTLRFFCGK